MPAASCDFAGRVVRTVDVLPNGFGGGYATVVIFWLIICRIFYKNRFVVTASDLALCSLVFLCIVFTGYAPMIFTVRFVIPIPISLFLFFILCKRDSSRVLLAALKLTVVVWFLMGAYQTLWLSLGLEPYVPGRFLAGRMGPKSLRPRLLTTVAFGFADDDFDG